MEFKDIADNLNEYLDKLVEEINNKDYTKKEDLKNINGIYVFYENNKPIYVGRTNRKRMRKRIQEHSRTGSDKNSATFAYLLYLEKNKDKNISTNNPEFIKVKNRVKEMKLKFVEINDEIIQTIFEPYLAYKLGTEKFNKFKTH